MKRDLVLLLTAIFLVALEGALMRRFGVMTDVGALLLAFAILERPVLVGAGLAVALGYLHDITAGTSRGLYSSAYLIAFFMLRLPVSRVAGGGPAFVTSFAAVTSLATLAVALVLEHTVGPGRIRLASLLSELPAVLVAAAVLGYPLFRLLRALDERFKEREEDFVFRP